MFVEKSSMKRMNFVQTAEFVKASVKGSLGVIYFQKTPLNFQICMVGSEVLVIMKYTVT